MTAHLLRRHGQRVCLRLSVLDHKRQVELTSEGLLQLLGEGFFLLNGACNKKIYKCIQLSREGLSLTRNTRRSVFLFLSDK